MAAPSVVTPQNQYFPANSRGPRDCPRASGCKIPALGKSLGPRGVYFPIHPSSRQCTDTLSILAMCSLHRAAVKPPIVSSPRPVCCKRSGFDLAQVMTTGRRTNHVYVHHISARIRHTPKPGQPEASRASCNQPGGELTTLNQ